MNSDQQVYDFYQYSKDLINICCHISVTSLIWMGAMANKKSCLLIYILLEVHFSALHRFVAQLFSQIISSVTVSFLTPSTFRALVSWAERSSHFSYRSVLIRNFSSGNSSSRFIRSTGYRSIRKNSDHSWVMNRPYQISKSKWQIYSQTRTAVLLHSLS